MKVKMITQSQPVAVSCSPVGYRLGGVGFGSGMTGKLGRAWLICQVPYSYTIGLKRSTSCKISSYLTEAFLVAFFEGVF